MALNWTVVQAFRDCYTPTQLADMRKDALAEIVAGVTVTQVTFEGGGASGTPNGRSPDWLLEHVQAALGTDTAGSAAGSFMDLSKRPFST